MNGSRAESLVLTSLPLTSADDKTNKAEYAILYQVFALLSVRPAVFLVYHASSYITTRLNPD